jgi:predicted O-methyltransferase YrrM
MLGTCSDACNNRLLNGQMRPQRVSQSSTTLDESAIAPRSFTNLDQYSRGHSSPPASVYREIEYSTQALLPSGSHMVSGAAQGRLLAQLASMTREGRMLELGTFTGYATTCLLEGALKVADVLRSTSDAGSMHPRGSREGGPYVLTMERDHTAFGIAVSHVKAVAEYGLGVQAAEAVCALRSSSDSNNSLPSTITLACDGGRATCELVQVSDALAVLEEMAAGRGDLLPAPFDFIFVDADKTRLLEYADACLASDRLLKKGGLLVVDNVLWKGLVLEASTGDFSSLRETTADDKDQVRKNRRARKLATKMHRFNAAIVQDPRAEVLVLPLRDGLSVIRKK